MNRIGTCYSVIAILIMEIVKLCEFSSFSIIHHQKNLYIKERNFALSPCLYNVFFFLFRFEMMKWRNSTV